MADDRWSQVSEADLQALSQGRLSEVSDQALALLAGEPGTPPPTTGAGRLLDAVTTRPEQPLGTASPVRFAARALNTAAFRVPELVSAQIPGRVGIVAQRLFHPQTPGLADVAGDITGFMVGAPAATERAVADTVGRSLGSRFLAKASARAAGGVASMVPFAAADVPEKGWQGAGQEALGLAEAGAVLPNVFPVAKAAIAGTGRGLARSAAWVVRRGLEEAPQTSLLTGGGVKPTKPSLMQLFTAGKRQLQARQQREAALVAQGQAEAANLTRAQAVRLAALRAQTTTAVQHAEDTLRAARTSPELGMQATQAAARIQQRIAGEGGYAHKVYAGYDQRLDALEKAVADNETIQVSRRALQDALLKDIPRTPDGAPAPRDAGEVDVAERAAHLGEGVAGVRQIKDLLKELRAGASRARASARRVTPADHARMQAVSNVMDVVAPRNEAFANVQSWYKGHARVLDRAFRLLRPRGDVYETAARLQGIGARPSAVRGAALQELEAKAQEVGVQPRVQQEADALMTEIRALQEQAAQTRAALGPQQAALTEVHRLALEHLAQQTEARLKTARHLYRQYAVSTAGRAAGVSELPIRFPVPTLGSESPRFTTRTAGQVAQLFRTTREALGTVRRGLTPPFVKRGGTSRLMRGYVATQREE